MQLLLLLLKNDENQTAEGHQGGCQWEAPPEGAKVPQGACD